MTKTRRAQIAVVAALVVALVASVAAGAFRTWTMWDYVGWWVLLPIAVMGPIALALGLIRLLSRKG